MKITELLESPTFNKNKFVDKHGSDRKINYDLIEDLIHYMNNNDTVYRKHLYPSIVKCVDSIQLKRPTNSDIFKQAVIAGYNSYINEYPIRELPDRLTRSQCKKICDAILEEVKTNASNGKYDF